MKTSKTILLLSALATVVAGARTWEPDPLLGTDYVVTTVDQGRDYSGPVTSTVIRGARPQCPGAQTAVLYVHGFNDYFFQDSVARYFEDRCMPFYAVDLRKYGRSHRPGQTLFQVRDMHEYYADIDSALAIMAQDGYNNVVLMGHSTGGLTTSLYMSERHPAQVKALVLNSPFLDWNQSRFQEKVAIPAVSAMAPLLRKVKINTGGDDRYWRSLAPYVEMDSTLKLPHGATVDPYWMRAIDQAQADLANHPWRIAVPVLLMHSDRSVRPGDPDSIYTRADAVLDVDDISRLGRRLGPGVTEMTVPGGLHDLMIGPRAPLDQVLDWIKRKV